MSFESGSIRHGLVHLATGTAVLFCLAATASAETRAGGVLEGETVWNKKGSPYIVTEDVIVPVGSTLRIEPGVTVRFKPNIADLTGYNKFDLDLLIEGTLYAEGAENDSIYLTSDADRPRWQDWQGIVVKGPEARATIRGTHVEYCNTGITVDKAHLEISDSTIQFCDRYGIYFIRATGLLDRVSLARIGNSGGSGIGIWLHDESDVTIKNSFLVGVQNGVTFSKRSGGSIEYCIVSLCTGNGVVIQNSSPSLTHSTVSGNEYGVVMTFGATPELNLNNLFNNGTADVWIRDYKKDLVKLDLTRNYWGTTELAVIEDRVLDGVDNENCKAFAILEPYLTEAVVTDSSFDPEQ